MRARTTTSPSPSGWPSSGRASTPCCAAPRGPAPTRTARSPSAARLDVASHRVRVGEQPIHLTPREFEVLKVLVAHAGRLVTHGRLLRAVWGTAYSDEPTTSTST